MPAWRVRITYADAATQVFDIAKRYRSRGFGPGHRVALKLATRPEFLLHFLALNAIGVAVLPLNPDYRTAQLYYVLAHREAAAVVSPPQLDVSPSPRTPA